MTPGRWRAPLSYTAFTEEEKFFRGAGKGFVDLVLDTVRASRRPRGFLFKKTHKNRKRLERFLKGKSRERGTGKVGRRGKGKTA